MTSEKEESPRLVRAGQESMSKIAECEEVLQVYSTEIFLNTATIREVTASEINSFLTWNSTAKQTEVYALLQHQATNNQTRPNKFSQLQNNLLHLLTVTFLAI